MGKAEVGWGRFLDLKERGHGRQTGADGKD